MATTMARLLPVFAALTLIPALTVTPSPADAAARRKPHRGLHQHTAVPQTPARYRDDRLFMRGPIAFGGKYLGDDPDPFIRQMLLRDPGAVFGGEN